MARELHGTVKRIGTGEKNDLTAMVWCEAGDDVREEVVSLNIRFAESDSRLLDVVGRWGGRVKITIEEDG